MATQTLDKPAVNVVTPEEQSLNDLVNEVFDNVTTGEETVATAQDIASTRRAQRWAGKVREYVPQGRETSFDIGKSALAVRKKYAVMDIVDPVTGVIQSKRFPWAESRTRLRADLQDDMDMIRARGALVGCDIVCTQCTDINKVPNCTWHSSEIAQQQIRDEILVQGFLQAHPENAIRMANAYIAKAKELEEAQAAAQAAAQAVSEGQDATA